MNIIELRLYPTRGLPNNVFLVANAWYNCSTRYDMRSEFGISDPRAGPAGHENGPPAGSCKFAKRRIRGPGRGSDPRVGRKQRAGHGDPTPE